MGQAIDATGIQFKLLNRSRGPAVWSPRAQADKHAYSTWVADELVNTPNIEIVQARAGRILIEHGRVAGLELEDGGRLRCRRARGYDRDVPERADSRRPRSAPGRSPRRAAIARRWPSRFAVVGFDDGAAQDRDAAAAASPEHRLRRVRGARRVRRGDVATRSRSRSRSRRRRRLRNQRQLLAAAHERSRARSRPRSHRGEPAVQRSDPGHRTALLPVARRQGDALSRSRAPPDLTSSRRGSTWTRST